MPETVLVTGAHGCIGAWTVREAAQRGFEVVALDIRSGWGRMERIVEPELRVRITLVEADVSDLAALRDVFERYRPRRVIHLAAMLSPACRDDPARGAAVNVGGTVNVFDAASAVGAASVVYASTATVFGEPAMYPPGPLPDDAPQHPLNHYAAYKASCEKVAGAYWHDKRFPSVGLRPGNVYGPGRDQGLTAALGTTLEALARGESAVLPFSGPIDIQFVPDIARALVDCALKDVQDHPVFSLSGTVIDVADYVQLVEELMPEAKDRLTVNGSPLPFPAHMAGDGLVSFLGANPLTTPLRTAIEQTVAFVRERARMAG